eukprot:scaffold12089_cov176-Ochromonas_danica.AAC.13
MSSYSNIFEEEMVRLAEEMSLQDAAGLSFYGLGGGEAGKNRLQASEEIVQEYLELKESFPLGSEEELSDGPISDNQLRALFSGENGLDSGSDRLSISYSRATSRDHYRPSLSQSQAQSRLSLREEDVRHTIQTIHRNLLWYRNHIVDKIEETNEEQNLATLLALNDKVSAMLAKTETLIEQDTVFDNTSFLGEHPSSPDHEQLGRTSIPAYSNAIVDNAIYTLRRGGDRQAILQAVEDLIKLGDFTGTVSLSAVKQMTSAGTLQVLLTTLSRAGDWPEVELLLCKCD